MTVQKAKAIDLKSIKQRTKVDMSWILDIRLKFLEGGAGNSERGLK